MSTDFKVGDLVVLHQNTPVRYGRYAPSAVPSEEMKSVCATVVGAEYNSYLLDFVLIEKVPEFLRPTHTDNDGDHYYWFVKKEFVLPAIAMDVSDFIEPEEDADPLCMFM